MPRSGTEAIRTQIQPSKPKREITKITNNQNTKRTSGQTREQFFPKLWPLSIQNRTKNNINTHKMKRQRHSDTKNRQQRANHNITIALDQSVMNKWGLKLLNTTKKQTRGLNRYSVLRDSWRSLDCQTNLKYEAKAYHHLSHSRLSNTQKCFGPNQIK